MGLGTKALLVLMRIAKAVQSVLCIYYACVHDLK